jgi:hypothetical protein
MKIYFSIAALFLVSVLGCKFNKQIPKEIVHGKIISFDSTPLPIEGKSIVYVRVTDLADNQAVPFAKVVLSLNSNHIISAVTDIDGKFKITELETGKYVLKIIGIGYETVELPINIVKPAEMKIEIAIEKVQIRVEKPVIYLYPTKKSEVSICLNYNGKLMHTYPVYPKNGWRMIAEPNGTLWDENGLEYYALFWEGKPVIPIMPKDGFVVPGKNTVQFLEEKLSYLGLNRREANEFIMYWLPQMENNAYNLIHFAGKSYEEQAKLIITPTPETCIRVMMLMKPLDSKIDFPLQDLSDLKKSRKGFTVVEWGGCLLTSISI